jgi:hypothetical protein
MIRVFEIRSDNVCMAEALCLDVLQKCVEDQLEAFCRAAKELDEKYPLEHTETE